uniref:Putative secreted protein n=1 Tax=Ixodes ricinus TaxID=34613 RepID=A0A6B0UD85_IXORI
MASFSIVFISCLHFSGNVGGIPSRLSLWLMNIVFFRRFIVAFCFCHISYRFWTIRWDPFCNLGDVLLYRSPTKEILLDLSVPSVCERSLANESIG